MWLNYYTHREAEFHNFLRVAQKTWISLGGASTGGCGICPGSECPGRLLRRWAAICRLRYRPLEEAGGEKAEHQAVGTENPEFAAPDQTNQDGQREIADNARDDHADEGVPCGKPGQQRFACFL